MAVIEKRELQEDGHYQVSCYDSGSQKLTHRWLETEYGKKDGMEIEYFAETDEVRHKTNWKNGKKDGIEEIYEMVDVLHGRHCHAITHKRSENEYYDTFDIQKKRKLVEKTSFINGEITSSEKISYSGKFDDNTLKILAETVLVKIGHMSPSAFNIVVVRDGLTNDIRQISFDKEDYDRGDGFSGSLYCYSKCYDMKFKEGKEYEGSCDCGRTYDDNKCSYRVSQGKLTGNFPSSDKKYYRVHYENNLLTKASYHFGHAFEKWSYNEEGQLEGLNIAQNDRGQIDKECTYKRGKLDGKYKETLTYTNPRVVECFYTEGILDGPYMEETKDTKIICSYKSGNLDGDYKEYKRDKNGQFVLSKECSYKNGVLDGKYVEYPLILLLYNNSEVKFISNLVYENGEIVSGEKHEIKVHPYRTSEAEVIATYKYENKDEYICTSYCDNRKVWHGTSSRLHYKNGLLDGLCKDFENGIEAYYKEGKKNGMCVEDTKYGKKESTYKDDVLDGQYTEYFANGKKKCEGNYSNGSKNGFWKTYADNGDLIEMRRFENGKDVTERYNKLKKIAAKHIEAEKKEEAKKVAKTGEKVRVTHNNHSLKGKFQKMIDKVTHDL